MGALELLASSQGRRDEVLNVELAISISKSGNTELITELVSYLKSATKPVKYDSIKVLYEVGARNPSLIASHIDSFIVLLKDNDNRLQWGAMTALATIAKVEPAKLMKHIGELEEAANNGSVITRDNYVKCLVSLAQEKKYHQDCITKLYNQLKTAPDNQLPMYAEMIVPIAPKTDSAELLKILEERKQTISKESKKKRIKKIIDFLKK